MSKTLVSTVLRRLIVALGAPALVLWGRDDPYVTPEYGERLAARIDAELVLFDDCGHWWPWQRAAESAAALEQLWSRA